MADFVIETADDASHVASERGEAPRRRATVAPRAQIVQQSEAHPPEVAHWDLRVRAAIIVGLAVLSWAAIGAGLFFLLRR